MNGKMVEKFRNENKVFFRRAVEQDVFALINSFDLKNELRGLALCGPNYKYYTERVFENILSELIVVERDPHVFRLILEETKDCKYYDDKKVGLIHHDIENVRINNARYIDLDLLETFRKNDWLISNHLKDQSKIYRGVKIFRFSASVRNDGGSKIRFNTLKRILKNNLGAHLSGFDTTKGDFGKGVNIIPSRIRKYAKRYIPVFYKNRTGRIIDMRAYLYNDTGTMFNCVIIYD